MSRISQRFLILQTCVFLAGASLMALEILAFRVIGKNFGTALRETSIVISVFLLAMSVGYWAGGRLADRAPRVRTFAIVLVAAGIAILPIPSIDPLVSDLIYGSPLPLPLHAFLVTLFLFAIPTLLLASVSPIAIRLLARSTEETGSIAGTTSAISTAGSITGSLAAAFVLIDWFRGVGNSIFAIAAVVLGCSILALAASRRETAAEPSLGRPARAVAGGILLIALAGVVLALFAARAPRPDDYSSDELSLRTVALRETPYHSIVIREIDGKYRYLAFGRFRQSMMRVDDPYGPGFEYTDFFHIPMVLRPDSENVLFLGLGGATGPKQFLRDYPRVSITAVEIDPGVVEVAREHFAMPEDPRLRIAVADGRTWLKSSREEVDVVLIDAFTVNRYGSSLPWHLTTREFFEELEARTSPEAIVLFNSPGGPESPISRALAKTMSRSFPYMLIFRTVSGNNTVIVASREEIGTTGEALASRIREMRAAARVRHPRLEERALQMVDVTPRSGAIELTDDHAPVDQLVRMQN